MNVGRMMNKVAMITGAGSGIGRATAMLMAQEGATVIIADIDRNSAEMVARDVIDAGNNAEAVHLDVSDASAWEHTMEKVLAKYQQLDVLVNNAGITLAKPVHLASLEDWRKVLAVNLDGVFLGTKQAIRTMKNGGSIVNVSSVSGIKPSAGAAAYCTSKAAIRMFSKTVAIECADANTGIRVNVVTPGGVKTPLWEKEDFFQQLINEHGSSEAAFSVMEGKIPSQRFYTSEEVAQTIFYLTSDESAHVTGAEIILDRGHTG